MIHLMVLDDAAPGLPTRETAFGGRPSVGAGFAWPRCSSCEGAMQFLGQLRDGDDHLIALFMCQNDPGGCDEWDAEGGGNRAWRFRADALAAADPPAEGETLRPVRHGARTVAFEAADYGDARVEWAEAQGVSPRQVLGGLGGEPAWLQGDETPDCTACGEPMDFVAQLETGPDHRTEMNFGGGGCACVFRCACSQDSARFLWQC